MQISAQPTLTYHAPRGSSPPPEKKSPLLQAFGYDLVSISGTRQQISDPYSAGHVLVRAAEGALAGALTVHWSGGGVGPTAKVGAEISGTIGAGVGILTGGLAGAAAGAPIPGAVVGGFFGGGVGAVRGAIHGAILGALGNVMGGGPIGGAIAGGLLAAAFPA